MTLDIIKHNLPVALKGSELHSVSIALFGFILETGDPRWKTIEDYVSIRRPKTRLPTQVEARVSMDTAIYLGPKSVNQELDHASVNMAMIGFAKLENNFPPDIIVRPHTTESQARNFKSELGVTACPEALHQLLLIYQGRYQGRVGINHHRHEGQHVISVANIQGVPDTKSQITEFSGKHGVSPFNFLLKLVKKLYPSANILGLKNPKNRDSAGLYNMAFKSEAIRRVTYDYNE